MEAKTEKNEMGGCVKQSRPMIVSASEQKKVAPIINAEEYVKAKQLVARVEERPTYAHRLTILEEPCAAVIMRRRVGNAKDTFDQWIEMTTEKAKSNPALCAIDWSDRAEEQRVFAIIGRKAVARMTPEQLIAEVL